MQLRETGTAPVQQCPKAGSEKRRIGSGWGWILAQVEVAEGEEGKERRWAGRPAESEGTDLHRHEPIFDHDLLGKAADYEQE